MAAGIAELVAELEQDFANMKEDYKDLESELGSLTCSYDDLMDSHKLLENELEWYRSTYPEGEAAYQVVQRLS